MTESSAVPQNVKVGNAARLKARFAPRGKTSAAKRLGPVDYAAVALAAAVFGYLFWAAAGGMGSIDESMYCSLVYRTLAGDRMLIDEWHVSQLSSVLHLLPYWLFTAVTGSTEGVILYLRYLFVAVDLIMYWYLYFRLRRYGVWALLSAALFCTCIPSAILMLNYYTMALHGLAVITCIFFFGPERKSVPVLLFAGLVLSCAVLAEPFLALLYFSWSLLVLLRALSLKKGKDLLRIYAVVLDGRTWFLTTVGIALTAAVFFAFLFSRSPLCEILKELPELFTDYEYSIGGKKMGNAVDFRKIFDALRFFGFLPVVGFLLSVPCALRRRAKAPERARLLLFIAVAVCFVGSYAVAVYLILTRRVLMWIRFVVPPIIFFYYFQGLPALFFGLDCFLLCDRKDRRIFGFWIVGAAASFFTDLSSELMLGTCAAVTFPAMLISLKTLLSELRKPSAAPSGAARRASASAVAACCLCAFLVWQSIGLYTYGFYHVVEDISADTAIDGNGEDLRFRRSGSASFLGSAARGDCVVLRRGPMKGIRTTARIAGIYNDILTDLDEIKARTKGPVYVAGLFCYFYLYMDLPIGTYSAWYVEEDSEVRQTRYWELHPERRPSVVYVPFRTESFRYEPYWTQPGAETWGEEKLAFLKTLCDFETEKGKEGFILWVSEWY